MARLPLYLNTRTLTSHLFFGPYIYLPLLAALTWLGGILALLGLWVKDGKPRYQGDEASVVFISDVGAAHKKLFIGICCTTSGLYIFAIFAERWLRHVDRLPADKRRREVVFDWMAIIFGTIGALGLVFLSIFDAFNYSEVHWSMTCVFIIFVALSAIFQSAEVWSLHKDHPDRKHLLRNAVAKLVVILFAIACAVGFAVTYAYCRGNAVATRGHSASKCNTVTSSSAALEWAVAFILTFYFLTLAADLWPAGESSSRYMRRLAKWQEQHGEGDDFTGRRAFEEYPERWQDPSGNTARGERMATAGVTPAGVGAMPGNTELPMTERRGMGPQSQTGWRARAERMRIAVLERNRGVRPTRGVPDVEARASMGSTAQMMGPPQPRFANAGPTSQRGSMTTSEGTL